MGTGRLMESNTVRVEEGEVVHTSQLTGKIKSKIAIKSLYRLTTNLDAEKSLF